ncbi:TIGR04197 family type VII secretion effector [Weizmannia sp. CD-2023]|jgi:type VII secretion effector (TIGR04197 family)|uniref:TIGR04197 family type VII secretion effector n=1 Tax=Heyndrickxia TaxID=2837504 RepID=UPI00145948B0|nr:MULTISPECIES: TIGR04197 family type VII secretion effector [Heyndrickxia]MED4321168.1 TIGR04197 family type VII secretion effector [Weizmannia sp. CD-2023]MED4840751.1 TIGR04197 family type VII secretion effector [Weizmannia sp. CD-2023]MED4900046.1 TIGR04197 family type VII secretion effector [Weizmannia sp. CD-2023]NMH84561.1 TIGR04197 family type VII secretion effector [Heyndrickxia coagulans]
MGETKLNVELFDSNIEQLQAAVSDMETNLIKTTSFDQTNINPFKEELKQVTKAMELLRKYKSILEADIQTLKNTGESIKKLDEQIEKSYDNYRKLQQ